MSSIFYDFVGHYASLLTNVVRGKLQNQYLAITFKDFRDY